MKYLLTMLTLLAFVAQAEVYKTVNEHGDVVYSDTPTAGAKRLHMPKLQTYSPLPLRSLKSIKRPAIKNDFYSAFAFTKPENNITIRDNLGVVQTELKLVPGLGSRHQHLIQYYLDDKPYGPPIDQLAVTMSNLERGEHRLSASVLDQQGNILISADDVVVHIKRVSLLHDTRLQDGDAGQQPHNPNALSSNPNVRTLNPNVRTLNPNIISNHPNVPSPLPAAAPR